MSCHVAVSLLVAVVLSQQNSVSAHQEGMPHCHKGSWCAAAVKSNLGGSHDYGEECDEFCDHVFKRFAAGEAEVGFTMSEKARLADRETLDAMSQKMFESMGKGMPVFESSA